MANTNVVICQDCKTDLPATAHIGGLNSCYRCNRNFGLRYCLECIIWYFNLKRKLCKMCEKSIYDDNTIVVDLKKNDFKLSMEGPHTAY